MGRAKLPRKSTNIDMTAMCDVAFLLLSFFILATKQKPPEIVPVQTPSSVQTLKIDKDKVLVIVSKTGKVFLTIDNVDKRQAILTDINQRLALNLTPAQIKKSSAAEVFGTPLNQLGSYLSNVAALQAQSDKLPGIPAEDSTHNELKDWLESASIVYTGTNMNLTVKGDNVAKYPVIKGILYAFKQNNLLKFNIITGLEAVDPSTDLYKQQAAKKAASDK